MNSTPESEPRSGGGGWLLLVAGIGLFVAGLIAGLTNLTAYGYDCGSAFGPNGMGIGYDVADFLVQIGCEDAVNGRRGLAITLVLLGLVAMALGGWLLARRRRAASPPAISVADELARLARLHASGALTDDEYAAAKAQALGS